MKKLTNINFKVSNYCTHLDVYIGDSDYIVVINSCAIQYNVACDHTTLNLTYSVVNLSFHTCMLLIMCDPMYIYFAYMHLKQYPVHSHSGYMYIIGTVRNKIRDPYKNDSCLNRNNF